MPFKVSGAAKALPGELSAIGNTCPGNARFDGSLVDQNWEGGGQEISITGAHSAALSASTSTVLGFKSPRIAPIRCRPATTRLNRLTPSKLVPISSPGAHGGCLKTNPAEAQAMPAR